jgi:hypothetical protein
MKFGFDPIYPKLTKIDHDHSKFLNIFCSSNRLEATKVDKLR